MLIGYLNLSIDELAGGVSAPQNALLAAGAARLFIDVDTGSHATPQLDLALAELRSGDGLISLSVQSLARTIDGLLRVHGQTERRGAFLRVLQMPGGLSLDTSSSEGRAILGALALMSGLSQSEPSAGAIAPQPPLQTSREASTDAEAMIRARSRGRPATAGSKAGEVTQLHAQGLRAVDIAATLGIGRASVYRILSQGVSEPSQAAKPERQAQNRSVSIAAATGGRFDPFSGR